MKHSKISLIALCVSFLGFADAAYLTLEHFLNRIPPCTVGGCEVVLTSPYAVVAGVPIALFGALYYIVVFFLILYGAHRRLLVALVSLGFVASLALIGLQAFVINAWCLYCLGSAATSTTLFIILVCLKSPVTIISTSGPTTS